MGNILQLQFGVGMRQQLLYLHWSDYAQVYHKLYGKQPKYAPTQGDFYTGRFWAKYKDDTLLSGAGVKPPSGFFNGVG